MALTSYESKPIILKRLLKNVGIYQTEISSLVSCCRETLVYCLNHCGYIPGTNKDKKETCRRAIEEYLGKNKLVMAWLQRENLNLADIWQADNNPGLLHAKAYAQVMPNKTELTEKIFTIDWEVEMLTNEAKKQFKLFRDPFIDDVQQESDIYMSDEHRYIEAAMLDAARHSGFLAIVGDVGSGKSTIRKKVFSQLKRDNNVLIISPQCINKSKLTESMICDAVIRDISNEILKNKLEDKTRQVIRILTERADSNQRHCLFIEEAHDLSQETLKYLKRFYELEELEDGFRRLLGIILVGQLEMKRSLDERSSFDAREVIRRCQIVELGPLDGAGDLEKYLSLKFKRLGIDAKDIIQDDAYPAIRARLSVQNGKKTVSHLYPLLINNYVAKAINLATKCGQRKVTADVVYEI